MLRNLHRNRETSWIGYVYVRDVNETLGSETRPRHLTFGPRRDRDLPRFPRDRDETETFDFVSETRPRPRRSETRPRRFSRPCVENRNMLVLLIASIDLTIIGVFLGIYILLTLTYAKLC